MKLKQARKILINYLKENFIPENNGYPKQDNWRNIVTHCFRVEKYAHEISNSLNLTSNEKNTIRVTAIFHDIGYCKDWKEHPLKGKEILNKLLSNEPKKDIILNMVEKHSNKKINDDNILLSIIKDADILEKMGAMSVLMFGIQHDFNQPDFYHNVLEDLLSKDIEFCKKQMKLLQTEKAREICSQKILFIKEFTEQLEYEMANSYNMLQELC